MTYFEGQQKRFEEMARVDETARDILAAKIDKAKAELALDVLRVLRGLRDNCPDEWDALMLKDESANLADLWDSLRETIVKGRIAANDVDD